MIKTLTAIGTSKRLTVTGLALFLIGAGAVTWAVADRKNEKKFLNRHQLALDARSEKLNKLLSREIDIHSLTEVVPDEDWKKQINKYQSRRRIRELSCSAALVCIGSGGAIFASQLLYWTARVLIAMLSRLAKLPSSILKRFHRKKYDTYTEKDDTFIRSGASRDKGPLQADNRRQDCESLFGKYSQAAANAVRQSFDRKYAVWRDAALKSTATGEKKSLLKHTYQDDNSIAVLYCDENNAELHANSQPSAETTDSDELPLDHLARKIDKNVMSDYRINTKKIEDSIKTQTDNLEKQFEEFRSMTQSVKQAAIQHSEPINNAIEELANQVAAIREYASNQQTRMEKLQDGYDWNIVRTFCLRVIRCIDNLENRIDQLVAEGVETKDLEEARDDLIFALESSGVEQFEPEINSDYRQHQKFVEAVKDREPANQPNEKDKIAKVLRRGYRYVIDDENVKVVRTARVKLFGLSDVTHSSPKGPPTAKPSPCRPQAGL